MEFFCVKDQIVDASVDEQPCVVTATKDNRLWVVLDETHKPYTFEIPNNIPENSEISTLYGVMKCATTHPTFGQYADKLIIIIIVVHPDGSADVYVHEVEVE